MYPENAIIITSKTVRAAAIFVFPFEIRIAINIKLNIATNITTILGVVNAIVTSPSRVANV